MANTSTRDVSVGVRLPGKRYDRQFFMAMAILLFAVIAIGFAPTYYRAGFFRAPLPSRIVHIHAAVFSSWMLLLLVQTTLISAKRVKWHRQLGMAGFVLACLMVVMGFLIFADLAARVKPLPDSDATLGSLIVPFTDAFDFGVLAAMAYSLRRNPAAHKRLIVIATAGISGAAFFRWHFQALYHDGYAAYAASYIFLAILAAYDLWSTHKLQRATLWGSTFLIFMEQSSRVIGPSAAFHTFARWVQGLNL
jgi:hypothetical protein